LKEDSISLNNISVLCRTHNQCSIIADVLQKSGISTQPRFSSFFQIKEIRDIISWSQVVANGLYKETGFYRIIEQNCGYDTANKIYNYCNKKRPTSYSNLIENDKLLLNKYPKLLEIVSLVKSLRRSLAKRSASEVIWEIVTRINLLTEKSKKYTLDDHFVLLNVGNLLKRSQDFTKRNQIKSSLSSFNIYIESL
jgi:superfamily I DNA/RNA helicase